MNFGEVEKLCRKYNPSGDFDAILRRAVDEEFDDLVVDWNRQVPRRVFSSRFRSATIDRAKDLVCYRIEAELLRKKGTTFLGKTLSPDEVLRTRRGCLTAWALARKLREKGAHFTGGMWE